MADSFYQRTIKSLCSAGKLLPDARILVVAGGRQDRDVLLQAGLKNVTISNLDERMKGNEFEPFSWAHQDAEKLTYADGEFDHVIVHAGLHHCYSPHRALLEMYRVARKSIVVFEARDSFLVNAGLRAGLTASYEITPVVEHSFRYGGVANSSTPNFVYRWTEREFKKAICSFDPSGEPRFSFFYGLRIPLQRIRKSESFARRVFLAPMAWAAKFLFLFAPLQGNEFAACIERPRERFPWLNPDQSLNKEWAFKRFPSLAKRLEPPLSAPHIPEGLESD